MEKNQAVMSLVTGIQNSWNNADGEAFAKLFADTSTFIDIKGNLHSKSTRQYLAEAHNGIWNSIYKGSKITYELLETIALSDEILLVNLRSTLDAPVGPLAGKNSSTITMVLIKIGANWKVKLFHNTLVAKQ